MISMFAQSANIYEKKLCVGVTKIQEKKLFCFKCVKQTRIDVSGFSS